MIIDGKALAELILRGLTEKVITLKEANITPTMAVILVGDDPGSLSYIKQKRKAGERIGAKVIFEQLPETISKETLQSAIAHYNNDPSVHGLIVQRPIPKKLGEVAAILDSVAPEKDVDGFVPNSPFQVPVARAVVTMLDYVHTQFSNAQLIHGSFKSWLMNQSIAVLGRGDTAGKPIALELTKLGASISVIHSKTAHPEKILKNATVIVSCVGRQNVITKRNLTPGVILISVGIWRNSVGKIHGDYDIDDIAPTAAFYTPTPGGVGPVNVACLMHNLVDATIMKLE